MVDEVEEKPPEQVRGRPFAKGRSGNPAGRRLGSRNKATVAAQEPLANEAEALTRKAVEAALAGDPMAMRLCLERILPANAWSSSHCRRSRVRPMSPRRWGRLPPHSPTA